MAKGVSDGEVLLDVKVQTLIGAFVPALLYKFKDLHKSCLCTFSVEVKFSALFTLLQFFQRNGDFVDEIEKRFSCADGNHGTFLLIHLSCNPSFFSIIANVAGFFKKKASFL